MNLYVVIAVVLGLAASHGAAYYKGYSNSSQRARIEVLEQSLKAVQDAYDREQTARKLDAQQALADAKDSDLDVTLTKELEDALDNPDADVFGAPDADGLRKLINPKNP